MPSYTFLRPAPAAVEAAIAEHERLTAAHQRAGAAFLDSTSASAQHRAAARDREALSNALASGDPDPGERFEEERKALARRAERERDALAPLVEDAAAAVIAAVAEASPSWRATIDEERAGHRQRVRELLTALSGELAALDAANLRDRTVGAVAEGLEGVALARAMKPVASTVRVAGVDGPTARATADTLLLALSEYGAKPAEVAPAHVPERVVVTTW